MEFKDAIARIHQPAPTGRIVPLAFELIPLPYDSEALAPASDADVERGLDLPQVLVERPAEVGEALVVDRLESELEGKEYLAGTFSIADIAFMANFDFLDRFAIAVDPNKHKNTAAWIDRLKARPSYAASAT